MRHGPGMHDPVGMRDLVDITRPGELRDIHGSPSSLDRVGDDLCADEASERGISVGEDYHGLPQRAFPGAGIAGFLGLHQFFQALCAAFVTPATTAITANASSVEIVRPKPSRATRTPTMPRADGAAYVAPLAKDLNRL